MPDGVVRRRYFKIYIKKQGENNKYNEKIKLKNQYQKNKKIKIILQNSFISTHNGKELRNIGFFGFGSYLRTLLDGMVHVVRYKDRIYINYYSLEA